MIHSPVVQCTVASNVTQRLGWRPFVVYAPSGAPNDTSIILWSLQCSLTQSSRTEKLKQVCLTIRFKATWPERKIDCTCVNSKWKFTPTWQNVMTSRRPFIWKDTLPRWKEQLSVLSSAWWTAIALSTMGHQASKRSDFPIFCHSLYWSWRKEPLFRERAGYQLRTFSGEKYNHRHYRSDGALKQKVLLPTSAHSPRSKTMSWEFFLWISASHFLRANIEIKRCPLIWTLPARAIDPMLAAMASSFRSHSFYISFETASRRLSFFSIRF